MLDKQGYMQPHAYTHPRARAHARAHTHKYVIFISFPRQQWFANAPQSYIIRTLSCFTCSQLDIANGMKRCSYMIGVSCSGSDALKGKVEVLESLIRHHVRRKGRYISTHWYYMDVSGKSDTAPHYYRRASSVSGTGKSLDAPHSRSGRRW
jgi:hypothetical protein